MTDERVVRIDMGVAWEVGDSGVRLLQSESRTFLVFYLAPVDLHYTDTQEDVGIIEWHRCQGAVLGYPNDEGLHGHRLWEQGLREIGYYEAAEVQRSAWIAELRRAASAHRRYDPGRWRGLRHFILLFHDTTFECVAEGFTLTTVTQSMEVTLHGLVDRLLYG